MRSSNLRTSIGSRPSEQQSSGKLHPWKADGWTDLLSNRTKPYCREVIKGLMKMEVCALGPTSVHTFRDIVCEISTWYLTYFILIRKSALLSTLSKKHLRVCEILKSLCTVDEVSQHSTFAAENRRDCTVLKRCENDPKPQPPGTIWKFVGLKINSRHMLMWFSFAFTGSRLYSRKTNPKNLKSAVL